MEGQMDRGVVVGGGLIAASFLVAVLLNRSANNEVPPVKAPHDVPAPCEQVVKSPPAAAGLPDPAREECEGSQPAVLKR
jgi:hypothetical protein